MNPNLGITSDLLQRIAHAQQRRMRWLLLAHLPALLCGWLMGWSTGWALAVVWIVALHLLLLWGTLNPHSVMFGAAMNKLPTSDANQVWLTIDDGPSTDTHAILDLLQRHQAKATFFLVAERARRHPELVRAIAAAGHDIGNHTDTHPAAWFWALPPRRMAQEIVAAQHVLTELTGQAPRWFRSVAGHTNPLVQPALELLQLRRVAWSERAYDAVDSHVERVVAKLSRQLAPGAIILMHEGARHGRSVAMIEGVLQQLDAQGYRAVLPEQ